MEKFTDDLGNTLNVGDKCEMEIVGLGRGEVEIQNDSDGDLAILDPNQGYYKLKFYKKREDVILTKIG